MSEINKINLNALGPGLKKAEKSHKEPTQSFESELAKTVAQLEDMNHEIDNLMQSTQTEGNVTQGVTKVGNYIQSVAGIVENLAPEPTKGAKNVRFAAAQYQKMQKDNGS